MDLKLNSLPVCLLRGAGQEDGRSCHILEFKGKKISLGMKRSIIAIVLSIVLTILLITRAFSVKFLQEIINSL